MVIIKIPQKGSKSTFEPTHLITLIASLDFFLGERERGGGVIVGQLEIILGLVSDNHLHLHVVLF